MIWWGGTKDNIPPGWAVCNGVDNSKDSGGGGWDALTDPVTSEPYHPFVSFCGASVEESAEPSEYGSEDFEHTHIVRGLNSRYHGVGKNSTCPIELPDRPLILDVSGEVGTTGTPSIHPSNETDFTTPDNLGFGEDDETAAGGVEHRHGGNQIASDGDGHTHGGGEHGHHALLHGVPGVHSADVDQRPKTGGPLRVEYITTDDFDALGDDDDITDPADFPASQVIENAKHNHQGSKLEAIELVHTKAHIAGSIADHPPHDHNGASGITQSGYQYLVEAEATAADADVPATSKVEDSNFHINDVNDAFDFDQPGAFIESGLTRGDIDRFGYTYLDGTSNLELDWVEDDVVNQDSDIGWNVKHSAKADVEHAAHEHTVPMGYRAYPNGGGPYSETWDHSHYIDDHHHFVTLSGKGGTYGTQGYTLETEHADHVHDGGTVHHHDIGVSLEPPHKHDAPKPKPHAHPTNGDIYNNHVHSMSYVGGSGHSHPTNTLGIGLIPIEPVSTASPEPGTRGAFTPNPCRPSESFSLNLMGSEDRRNFQEMFRGGDELPVGSIILWPRSAQEVPMGWSICNGTQKSAVFPKSMVGGGVDLSGSESTDSMVRLVGDVSGKITEYPPLEDRPTDEGEHVHAASVGEWKGTWETGKEDAFDEKTSDDEHGHDVTVEKGGEHTHTGGEHTHVVKVYDAHSRTQLAGSHTHEIGSITSETIDPHNHANWVANISSHGEHVHHVLSAPMANNKTGEEGVGVEYALSGHANVGGVHGATAKVNFTTGTTLVHDVHTHDEVIHEVHPDNNGNDAALDHTAHTHENMVAFQNNEEGWDDNDGEVPDKSGGSHYHHGEHHDHKGAQHPGGGHKHYGGGHIHTVEMYPHKHNHKLEENDHAHLINGDHTHGHDVWLGGKHRHECGRLNRIWCMAIEKVSSAFDVT